MGRRDRGELVAAGSSSPAQNGKVPRRRLAHAVPNAQVPAGVAGIGAEESLAALQAAQDAAQSAKLAAAVATKLGQQQTQRHNPTCRRKHRQPCCSRRDVP